MRCTQLHRVWRYVLTALLLAVPATSRGVTLPVSASIVPGTLTQGLVQASLGAATSYNVSTNNLGDWPVNTGGTATKFAVSLTNANFNGNSFGGTPSSIVAFGNGGGVTVQFSEPIRPLATQKEFGIFTAQMIVANSGALFSGNMEAAILVSTDGSNWVTLDGTSIASPTTYTSNSYKMNAPAMGYDFTTAAKAWTYGSPGTSAANLASLSVASYTTPMPDDNLFNGTGTNAQRLAFKTDASEASYDAIFGSSGGGNWFDISGSGLAKVRYLRLNGANMPTSGTYGLRLDAVFANSLAVVPEPGTSMLLAFGGLLSVRRLRRHRSVR